MLSQDEARFPLVPTLRATLGVKGHRPVVGTWDNKDVVYAFAALNVVTGRLTTRLLDSPAASKRRTGQSKTARLQPAFAAHLRDIARAYPATLGKPVVITIDNAPWHQGTAITKALAAHPHLHLYRLPSLQSPIECGRTLLARVTAAGDPQSTLSDDGGVAHDLTRQSLLLPHHAPQGVIVALSSAQAKSCKGHRCMNQSAFASCKSLVSNPSVNQL